MTDIITQLCGEVEGWDQCDALSFVLYGCEKFEGKDVNLCLDYGKLEVLSDDGTEVEKTFEIVATLKPV